MSIALLIVLLFILFGGFGVYGVRQNWYGPGIYGGSGIGLVLAILLILWLLGYIR